MSPRIYSTTYVAILMFCTLIAIPTTTNASYTGYGQEFNTLEEFVAYTNEYNRVYNELHGIRAVSTPATIRSTIKTTSSTGTRASTRATVSMTTGSAAAIDMYSARLLGSTHVTRKESVRVWFEYGTRPDMLTERTAFELLDYKRSTRSFDRELRNLSQNTLYYYRAVGTSASGNTAYGSLKTFRTAVDPSVDSAAVRVSTDWWISDLDENRALLEGSINFRKASYARVWFEYSDEKDDLYERTPIAVRTPSSGDEYSYMVTDLEEDTTYYYRIVGEDPSGARSYGSMTSFTTRTDVKNERPSVRLDSPSTIGLHGATISGFVDMNDFKNGVVFLVYGENRDKVSAVGSKYTEFSDIYEQGDDLQKFLLDRDLDSFDSFEKQLSYLDLDTDYYVTIGVEYENTEEDSVLLMSSVSSFATKSPVR